MNELRKIYIIRHCEPQFLNNIPICIGKTDIPLSEKGINKAKELKNYFSNINLKSIYSSPLARAKKTAEIIADNKISVEIKNDFSEFNIGKWDGMSFADIKEIYPKEYKDRGEDLENYIVEGGESMAMCRNRALKELWNTIEKSNGNIIIVAHAGVNRAIISSLLGISIKESFLFRHDYGSVNTVIYDGSKLKVSKVGEIV